MKELIKKEKKIITGKKNVWEEKKRYIKKR